MSFSKMPASGFVRHARRGATVGLTALLAMVPLAGCSGTAQSSAAVSSASAATTAASATLEQDASIDHLLSVDDRVSSRDQDASYDDASACHVTLADAGSSADGTGVALDGSTVTIAAGGTYVLTGSLADGQVVVDAEGEKVQLVLDGASVSCSTSAALYVRGADKVFVTLADGSSNALTSTGTFEADGDVNVDGAVFAKADLAVNGTGSLDVASAAGHGIVCKDDLALVSGEAGVTAAGHAIQAKDSVTVVGGTWTLAAGTDGIHCGSSDDEDEADGSVLVCGGSLDITAASDGFDATGTLEVDGGEVTVDAGDDGLHSDAALQVDGGAITVSGCYEGLEGATVSVNGGDTTLISSDDGLNATGFDDDAASDEATGATTGSAGDSAADEAIPGDLGVKGDPGTAGEPGDTQPGGAGGGMNDYVASAQICLNGGTLAIQAGGDGVDSNGDLTVTGGKIYVSGPTSDGDGSLDYAGTATVTGGIMMCAGSSGMAQNFGSDSTQGSMLVSASGGAGDAISLADASGNVLASFTAATDYDCVLVTAPGVESGQAYTLSYGGQTKTVEMSDTIYSDVTGAMGGAPGAMGGQPGQMGGQPGQGGPGAAPIQESNGQPA